jgi:hypothetical protein
LIICFGAILLLGQSASAATYYVSTSGSDSNSGLQSAPFRHLSKGAAAATNPGDIVVVMDGTYDNEGVVAPNYVVTLNYSGTPGNPITFMAQNRGQAILDSMNTSPTTSCNGASAYFNLYNAAYVVIQGFVIQNSCDTGIESNDNAHDITIQWNEIRNVANHTVTDQYGRDGIYLNNGEYNFTFDGNIFHDIGRTDGQSDLHFDHGIYSHGEGMTIINNVFYNMNRGWSIQLADGAANWLVANNTFAFGNANGEAGQIMFWGANTNIVVDNNIFYSPNTSALSEYAATITGTFDHNLVFGVNGIMSGDATGLTLGSNQVGPDPLFLSAVAAAPNFHLQTGSPAIASGITLPAVISDILGNTRLSPPDLGAYQSTAAGPAITGVFTSNVTPNSAVVNWSTNEGATSSVQYGPTGYATSTTPAPSMVMQHSVALAGLSASSVYHYRAASQDANGTLGVSGDFVFTTATPVVPTTFSVSASTSAVTVTAGQSISANVSASLLTGNAAVVSFSASGQPVGTTTFSVPSCMLNCSSTVTFVVAANATPGLYNVVISGAGAGVSASIPLAFNVTAAVDITSGLVANWLSNQTSGTVAQDSSGNGNSGAIANGYWWNSGPGAALWFNGSSNVSVNESATLELSNQLTVSFWLDPNANSNTDPRVIDKLYDWDVKLNGADRHPQLEASGQYAILNYSLPLNTWHHIAFTYSNGVVSGYVDGVSVPFLENTFSGTGTLAQWAYGLYLGTDGTNPLIGSLSDVRVYNRALGAADIAALFAAK